MRRAALLFLVVTTLNAAPRIDNVLVRMVPRGVDSLVGAHMDQLLASDLYNKLIAQQKLPQLDQFARETGFDPRKDVREVLLARGFLGSALLARGNFNPNKPILPNLKVIRHGEYVVYTLDRAGYCILDKTLAVAGDLDAVYGALDEWHSGNHAQAQPLLKVVAGMNEQTQLWGVSNGFAQFLASNLPKIGTGVDFASIFKGIESTWFSANVTSGFQAEIHAATATEHDAEVLKEAAAGLVGFGRLNVPDNQPALLKFWDGFEAHQDGKAFTLTANVSGDLIDQMVKLLSMPGDRAGTGHTARGGRGASGRRLLPPGR